MLLCGRVIGAYSILVLRYSCIIESCASHEEHFPIIADVPIKYIILSVLDEFVSDRLTCINEVHYIWLIHARVGGVAPIQP